MTLSFNPDDSNLTYEVFNSKEEWNTYMSQWKRENRTGYSPEPADTLPEKFPCLMVIGSGISYIPNGNDTFPNFFIYNFTVTE